MILLDTHFSSYMRVQIKQFSKRIEPRVNALIAQKELDSEKYAFVNEIFHEMFAFIPLFA